MCCTGWFGFCCPIGFLCLLLGLWHVSCLVSPPWILVHFWSCSSCEGIQGLVSCTGIVHVHVVVCFLVWFVWFCVLGVFWVWDFGFCAIFRFVLFLCLESLYNKMDPTLQPYLPCKWIARSSTMVYWAIAEAFLRARWFHRPISY